MKDRQANSRIYQDIKRSKVLKSLSFKTLQKENWKKILYIIRKNHKSLKRVEGSSKGIPKALFQGLLNLKEYNLNVYDEQSWKILLFHRNLRSLIIDASSEIAPNFDPAQLETYLRRILKIYPSLEPLEHLTIGGSYNQLILTILQRIENALEKNHTLKKLSFQKLIEVNYEKKDKPKFQRINGLVESISCTLVDTSTFFVDVISQADKLKRLKNLNVYFEIPKRKNWELLTHSQIVFLLSYFQPGKKIEAQPI